jgi:GMP synthase (glutamine-hydrolysing)
MTQYLVFDDSLHHFLGVSSDYDPRGLSPAAELQLACGQTSLRPCAPVEPTMLVVVQSDPEVPPGLIIELLNEKGVAFRLVRLFSGECFGDFEGLRGVIVLGGIMSVSDVTEFPFLQQLKEQTKEVVRKEIPYLGICLGGQLLAEVLGGRVDLQKRGELGCHLVTLTEQGQHDPLFAGVPKQFISFQWHSDSFEPPPGAVHLAWSDACPYQAFRWGKAAYGIQFHPEVTREIAEDWSRDLGEERRELLLDFNREQQACHAASLIFLANFLTLVQRRT